MPSGETRIVTIVGGTAHPKSCSIPQDIGHAFCEQLHLFPSTASTSTPSPLDTQLDPKIFIERTTAFPVANIVHPLKTPPEMASLATGGSHDDGVLGKVHIVYNCPAHRPRDPSAQSLLRLVDGALVVANLVLESKNSYDSNVNLSSQLETSLRSCTANRVRPLLFIDGLEEVLFASPTDDATVEDGGLGSLSLDDIYSKIRDVIDTANTIMDSYRDASVHNGPSVAMRRVAEELAKTTSTNQAPSSPPRVRAFSPEQGTVLFGSIKMGWAFTVPTFSERYAHKFGHDDITKLSSYLWRDWRFDKKNKLWTNQSTSKTDQQPLQLGFCEFCLAPLRQIWKAVAQRHSGEKESLHLQNILRSIGVSVCSTEISSTAANSSEELLRRILFQFLPLKKEFMAAVFNHLPSPLAVQRARAECIFRENHTCRSSVTAPGHCLDLSLLVSPQSEVCVLHLVRAITPAQLHQQYQKQSNGDPNDVSWYALGRVFGGVLRKDSSFDASFIKEESYGYVNKNDGSSSNVHINGLFASRGGVGARDASTASLCWGSLEPQQAMPSGELVIVSGKGVNCAALGAATLVSKPTPACKEHADIRDQQRRLNIIHRPLHLSVHVFEHEALAVDKKETFLWEKLPWACQKALLFSPYPLSVSLRFDDDAFIRAVYPDDIQYILHFAKCLLQLEAIRCGPESGGETVPVEEAGQQQRMLNISHFFDHSLAKVEGALRTSITTMTSKVIMSKSPNRVNRFWGYTKPLFFQADLAKDTSSWSSPIVQRDLKGLLDDAETGVFVPEILSHLDTGERMGQREKARFLVEHYAWDPAEARRLFLFSPNSITGANALINGTRGPCGKENFDESIGPLSEMTDAMKLGFNFFTSEGCLKIGAPMRGVCAAFTNAMINPDPRRRGMGQVIPTMRNLFCGAALLSAPILLEPHCNVEVIIPAAQIGRVFSALHSKRGYITGDDPLFCNTDGDWAPHCVRAYVPANEALSFHTAVTKAIASELPESTTQFRRSSCHVSVTFDNDWARLPGNVLEEGTISNDILMKALRRRGAKTETPTPTDFVTIVPDVDIPPHLRL